MQHVKAIPAVGYHASRFGYFTSRAENRSTIFPRQHAAAYNDHRYFRFIENFGKLMRPVANI